MSLLARDTLVHKLHYDVLRGYERDLLFYLRLDHSREDNNAVGDVVEKDKQSISQEEHLWNVNSADGAVVKCPLKPLTGKSIGEIC